MAQCHENKPNVFWSVKAKNKGRLIQTGANVLRGCTMIMLYNAVQAGMRKS